MRTTVACPSVSEVQEHKEVALANQAKVLLLKFFVENVQSRHQRVLATVKSLELSSWHPIHHQRQPMVGRQPVQDLAPPQTERMIQFRQGSLRLGG